MAEINNLEDPAPVSTVEDIQRRLLRPASLHSPQNLGSCDSSRLKVNRAEFQRNQERGSTKRKLVDFLDPVLLSVISSRIRRSKKETMLKTKTMRETKEFEWPVGELKLLVEESWKNRGNRREDEVVDLTDDHEASCRGGDRGGERSNPFEWFEQTALKRFNR